MMNNVYIDKRKRLSISIVKEVGEILCDNFGKTHKIKNKEGKHLVTDIDLRVEERIIKLVKKEYPQDDILSEERQYHFSNSEFSWIVDPLDGTHNYIRKIGIFGVSIALRYKEEIVMGVIYIPMTNELYIAEKGKGAYLNNKRINVSKRKLAQSTMVYDSRFHNNKDTILTCLGEVAEKVFNIRMFGSTVRSLSYLAEGKVDLEIEYDDKVWDFAAGLLLVEEAGGKSTDFQGKRWSPDVLRYVGSNGIIHQDILQMLDKRENI